MIRSRRNQVVAGGLSPLLAPLFVLSLSCKGDDGQAAQLPDTREPCAAHNPLRNAYFGDLHVHTRYSFDANLINGLSRYQQGPREAYVFAKGGGAKLPNLDGPEGQRKVPAIRPLDFAAVTDHSEYLGEVEICTDPMAQGYTSETCVSYRQGTMNALYLFGLKLLQEAPTRYELCGADGAQCDTVAGKVWGEIQQAAEEAYDRSAACTFTSFVGYEWTSQRNGDNMHRNVLFASRSVPDRPITYYDADLAQDLWTQLRTTCIEGRPGCDAMAIPHNANVSNGQIFTVESITSQQDASAARDLATFRAKMEPLTEIYQHKGDSECKVGVDTDDPLCDFEKVDAPACDGNNGPACTQQQPANCCLAPCPAGKRGKWCVEPLSFVRNALKQGLLVEEDARIGVNPLKLGLIGSTDTHNATPGATGEDAWRGHLGSVDDDPQDRLAGGEYLLIFGQISSYGPGGLAGVWAEENSRPSLFAALRRRETFGTSGTRMRVRFFGGWDYPVDACGKADLLQVGYDHGVPMGGDLPSLPAGATAPRFVVAAMADPGTAEQPGTPLQRIQIVKGWVEMGKAREKVYEVAGDAHNGATVDPQTCKRSGAGAQMLCAVFTDPDFKKEQRAFYYARVLEDPSCRWSTYDCLSLPADKRPPHCSDGALPTTIQERAWSSPIWYRPAP